jgi:hypothetical protein
VKPIHLNLAARPYRDYRPVYAVLVAMSLVAAFLMLNNVETYYRYIHETKSTRAKIAQIEDQARKERDSERATMQRMRGLDLNRLDRQTKFINAKLAERAFSWSTLLDELESVLADDVRLMSVSPSFDENGRIDLSLSFETKSGDGMITTINRMNADPQFEGAFPHNENALDNGNYAFNITARYLPPGIPSIRAAEVRR